MVTNHKSLSCEFPTTQKVLASWICFCQNPGGRKWWTSWGSSIYFFLKVSLKLTKKSNGKTPCAVKFTLFFLEIIVYYPWYIGSGRLLYYPCYTRVLNSCSSYIGLSLQVTVRCLPFCLHLSICQAEGMVERMDLTLHLGHPIGRWSW